MKKLVLLSALPGSGKSTWTKKYCSENVNCFVVSSDAIRHELTGSYQDFSKQDQVWKLFSERIHEYAKKEKDCSVILDCVCDTNKLRQKYIDDSAEFDYKILVVFNRTLEFCLEHNRMRPKEVWVPEEVIKRMHENFEQPSEEILKAFDEVITIDDFFNI